MKTSKFSEEQIGYALRQVEGGTAPADVCRQLGVSEATFYIWKKKYAHLGVSELRQLRSLEDDNARLKQLVADLSLDKHILIEALRTKSEALTAPRADRLGEHHLRRQRRAGLSFGAVQSGGLVWAQPGEGPDAIAAAHPRVGACAPTVWVSADLGLAPAGGVDDQYEAGATAVSAGRPAITHARASAQTHRLASRAGAGAGRPDGALEHGLRP